MSNVTLFRATVYKTERKDIIYNRF